MAPKHLVYRAWTTPDLVTRSDHAVGDHDGGSGPGGGRVVVAFADEGWSRRKLCSALMSANPLSWDPRTQNPRLHPSFMKVHQL